MLAVIMITLVIGMVIGAAVALALVHAWRVIEDRSRAEVERQSRRARAARAQAPRQAGVLVDARYAFRNNHPRLERVEGGNDGD